jgi:N-acetylglucosamine-6-sulfatase
MKLNTFARLLVLSLGVLTAVQAMPAQFQGRRFVANMEGRTPADWPTQTYYRYWMHMAHHDNPAHYGLRTKHHKLIFFYGLPLDAPGALKKPTDPWFELYDSDRDPHEMNNVVDDPTYGEVLATMKAALLKEEERIGDNDEKYPDLLAIRERLW